MSLSMERTLEADPNLLLGLFSKDARKALATHLTRVELVPRQTLFEFGDPLSEVYFPIDVVISLGIPLSNGEAGDAAMLGRHDVVGAHTALNNGVSFTRAMVQIGGWCLRCPVKYLKVFLNEHRSIRWLLAQHEQVLFAQVQQSAACNAAHRIENRLARCLLWAADQHGRSELLLTQQSLAQILGARRSTVTVIAARLQEAGLIHYTRGHISLRDIPALSATACECYQAVKSIYATLQR